jgi:hypothetical protein
VRGSTIRLGITEALTARQCSRAGDFHRDAVRVLHEALAGRAIREWPQTIVADPHCIETSEHPVEVLGVEGNVVKSVGCRRGALDGLVQMDGRLVVIIESRSWEAKLRSGTVNKPKSIAVKRTDEGAYRLNQRMQRNGVFWTTSLMVLYATAMHSISMSNSIGQDATGTKVREGGFSGKNRA